MLGVQLYICLFPPTDWQIIVKSCENWFQRNTHRLPLPGTGIYSEVLFNILGQVFLIRYVSHCRQELYWNCCNWWIFGELGNHSRISEKDQERHFSEHFCTTITRNVLQTFFQTGLCSSQCCTYSFSLHVMLSNITWEKQVVLQTELRRCLMPKYLNNFYC